VRIGGGDFRGRSVKAPSGRKTRPTSGRLKKSLFDILAPGLPGARVLDLFAGAGAVGIEALSRGAAHVTFVERNRRALKIIQVNLDSLGLSAQATLVPKDAGAALALLRNRGERFNVIFVDPPYAHAGHAALLGKISAASMLEEGGRLVVEHHHKTELPERTGALERVREVRAGETRLSFYAREE